MTSASTLVDRILAQRDAVLFGTHVRRTPREPGEACLVLPHYWSSLSLAENTLAEERVRQQEARLLLRAIWRSGHFDSLKEAIRHTHRENHPFWAPLVRVYPATIATIWNDKHAAPRDVVEALDEAARMVKEGGE